MTNTSLGAPLQRLVALNAELDSFPTEASFSASLAELNETSWNSSAASGGTASLYIQYSLLGALHSVFG